MSSVLTYTDSVDIKWHNNCPVCCIFCPLFNCSWPKRGDFIQRSSIHLYSLERQFFLNSIFYLFKWMKHFGIPWLRELGVKKTLNSENILVYPCKIKDVHIHFCVFMEPMSKYLLKLYTSQITSLATCITSPLFFPYWSGILNSSNVTRIIYFVLQFLSLFP